MLISRDILAPEVAVLYKQLHVILTTMHVDKPIVDLEWFMVGM